MKPDLYWVGFRVTVNLTQYQSYIYLTTLALIFLLPVVGRYRKKRGKEEREIHELREGISLLGPWRCGCVKATGFFWVSLQRR